MSEAKVLYVALDSEGWSIPRSAWTHQGMRAWALSDKLPDGLRASFVEGELWLAMSPEPIDTHNAAKTQIIAALETFVQAADLGEVYGDRVLFTNEDAGVSTEPDVMFVSFESIRAGRVDYSPMASRPEDRLEVLGSPDLVVEVRSDSSGRKDGILLREAYARAGVREYWMVDARGATVELTILALEGDRYVPIERSAVLDRDVRLTRTRSRVGRWRYRLDLA